MDERNVDVREKNNEKMIASLSDNNPLRIGHLDDLDRPSKSSSILSACSFYRSTWEKDQPPGIMPEHNTERGRSTSGTCTSPVFVNDDQAFETS